MEWLLFSGYKYAELPDLEVYPICSGQPVHGHSEVWIAVSKEDDENGVSFKVKGRPL